MTLRLHFALRSDVGHVREGNEDSAYAGSRLIAVADGMGGHAAGEVASSTVIALLAHLNDDITGPDLPGALSQAMREANAQLRDMTTRDVALDGMGTTVTAVLSSGSRLGVLHVGDSRAYLLRDNEMVQVTHDHTLVQDLVDQGRITAEQASSHPQRSLLMRALDGREVEPDLSVREARRGDRYLLCTDGLSGVVSDETIAEALSLPTPQDAVDRLVDLALKGGGPDNVTVVVADVVDDDATYADHPMVGGAAAEKDVVPGATPARDGPEYNPTGASAAAKAAHIRRRSPANAEADEYGDDEVTGMFEVPARSGGGGRRRKERGGRRRGLLVAGAVILVLVAAAAAGWAYLRTQYYVGVDQGRVAIFQGVHTSIAGISLSRVVQGQLEPVDQLEDLDRTAVTETIPVGSRKEAQERVASLTKIAPTVSPTARPSGSPSARPTPKASASPKTKAPAKNGAAKTAAGAAPICLAIAGAAPPPGCVPTTR